MRCGRERQLSTAKNKSHACAVPHTPADLQDLFNHLDLFDPIDFYDFLDFLNERFVEFLDDFVEEIMGNFVEERMGREIGRNVTSPRELMGENHDQFSGLGREGIRSLSWVVREDLAGAAGRPQGAAVHQGRPIGSLSQGRP